MQTRGGSSGNRTRWIGNKTKHRSKFFSCFAFFFFSFEEVVRPPGITGEKEEGEGEGEEPKRTELHKREPSVAVFDEMDINRRSQYLECLRNVLR